MKNEQRHWTLYEIDELRERYPTTDTRQIARDMERSTTGVQRKTFEVRPKQEYLIPVLQNSSGQTTSNVDGETKITVRPWYRRTPVA